MARSTRLTVAALAILALSCVVAALALQSLAAAALAIAFGASACAIALSSRPRVQRPRAERHARTAPAEATTTSSVVLAVPSTTLPASVVSPIRTPEPLRSPIAQSTTAPEAPLEAESEHEEPPAQTTDSPEGVHPVPTAIPAAESISVAHGTTKPAAPRACTPELRSPRGAEPADVIAAFFDNVQEAGQVLSTHLWLEDPASETLRLIASHGPSAPLSAPVSSSSGTMGAALATGVAQLAPFATSSAERNVAVRYAVPIAAGDTHGVAAVDLADDPNIDRELLTAVAAAMRGALSGALALHVAETEIAVAHALLDTACDLSRLVDPDAVVVTALTRAMQLSGAQTGSVMLLDESGEMHIVASRGLPQHVVDSTLVSQGEGIAGWVLASGQPLVVEDLHDRGPRSRRHGVRSAVCVPIADEDGVLGVLNVGSRTFHARFSRSHTEALEALARSVAVALRNARAMRTSQDLYFDTLKALAIALETKDPYSMGATERVVDTAVAIGSRMGLPEPEMDALKVAAMLHDVGMSAAGEVVVVADRPLSTVEWGMLKMHPVIAADILAQAPALKAAIPMVYHHHEHYDGSGYVVGLAQDQIPLGARILAVADAYVAMTSDRPYREALSHDDAMRELAGLAGTQFDPEIVQALIDVGPVTANPRSSL